MKFKTRHFFCSPRLLENIGEMNEVYACVKAIRWAPEFEIRVGGKILRHQNAYNKALEIEFNKLGWKSQPYLCREPRLKGDFQKNNVFVEVQFGNSATLYRDYYKFHYGLTKGLLSLAVLIVPTDPISYFPTRPESVNNMAEFDLAARYFNLLPIPTPIVLIGLLPGN